MSRRRILNISTEKKRDTMTLLTDFVEEGGSGVSAGPAILYPPSPTNIRSEYCVVFSPTARGATFSDGTHGTKYYQALRTSAITYCVGLREVITLQTTGPGAWQWRRICFTMKGEDLYLTDRDTFDLSTSPVARLTSDGLKRAFLNQDSSMRTRDVVFAGERNKDWNDVITARLDTNLIKPLYDKRMVIRSGNDAGNVITRKMWHAMGHNLRYDEDETGDRMTESYYSTEGRIGMGDYYVVDFFKAVTSPFDGTLPTFLQVGINSTYYWHER